MHIVSHNKSGPFEDRDDLRQYVMSDTFCHGIGVMSRIRNVRDEHEYLSDAPVLKRIFSVSGVLQVRSELRDITRTGIDTVVIRISPDVTWESVEPELHRVLESLKPVQS